MHVAERSPFLGMARMLWGFDITPSVDASGNPVIPDTNKYTQGFVCMPEEFPAVITPRSKERADIIRREWKQAEDELLDPVTKQWKGGTQRHEVQECRGHDGGEMRRDSLAALYRGTRLNR